MIALIQRVTQAQVCVESKVVGAISHGLLALIGVEKADTESEAERLAERLLSYRVFGDANDKMNRSLRDVEGGLLLVPQFTLAADTRKGSRPSFSSARAPSEAGPLFNLLTAHCQARYPHVQTGQFGAEMLVSLSNHGPVTLWLQT